MSYATQLKIIAILAVIGLVLVLRAYIESQQTINHFVRKKWPLATRPPRPTKLQKLLNFILWLPPANW